MSNWMNDALAPGDTIDVMRPAGLFVLRDDRRPDRRVRGRQRHHAGDLDHQERARHDDARDHAGVRQPQRRHRHLRRRARAPARGIRRPTLGASSPRLGARLPRCRGVRGAGRRPRARRLLRLRSGPVHGHRSRPGSRTRGVAPEPACSSSGSWCPATCRAVDGELGHRVARDPARSPQAHASRTRLGDTILEAARRAGLSPPFSCESGSCATCMAHLDEGSGHDAREQRACRPTRSTTGWVLTCQAIPTSREVVVNYDA